MKLSQFIAACFATVGFAVSIFAGMHAENGVAVILMRALAAMIFCYVCGYAAGMVAQTIAKEHAVRIAAKVAKQEEDAKKNDAQRVKKTEQSSAGVTLPAT